MLAVLYTYRLLIGSVIAIILLFGSLHTFGSLNSHLLGASNEFSNGELSKVHSPGNETLGFGKVYTINMPHRTDRFDILGLQMSLYNIKHEFSDGVYADEMKTLPTGMKALPDSRDLKGEIGTSRAHMNVWRKMIVDKVETALIFETDVDWNINVRNQLKQMAMPLRHLMAEVENPHDRAHIQAYDDTDPYGVRSGHWDILYMGWCWVSPGIQRVLADFCSDS